MRGTAGNTADAERPASDIDVVALRKAFQEAQQEYQREFDRLTPAWKFAIGPVRFQRHIGSTAITWLYTVFNFICLAAGIVACLARGTWTSLGVALVVGALFSFGAFVSQWWVVEMGREDKINDSVAKDAEYTKLASLLAKRDEVAARLRQAEGQAKTPG